MGKNEYLKAGLQRVQKLRQTGTNMHTVIYGGIWNNIERDALQRWEIVGTLFTVTLKSKL